MKEKIVRLEMARGKVAAPVADVANRRGSRWSRRQYRSRRSNGETATDSTASDDAVKKDVEPVSVDDIKVDVGDA